MAIARNSTIESLRPRGYLVIADDMTSWRVVAKPARCRAADITIAVSPPRSAASADCASLAQAEVTTQVCVVDQAELRQQVSGRKKFITSDPKTGGRIARETISNARTIRATRVTITGEFL